MKFSTTFAKRSLLLTLVLTLFIGLPATISLRRVLTRSNDGKNAPTSAEAREAYGRIPLNFEANHGQTDNSVDFIARGPSYTLFLKPSEAVFALRSFDSRSRKQDGGPPRQTDTRVSPDNLKFATPTSQAKVLRMKLLGSNTSAAVIGEDEAAGKVNYFTGNDPAKWRTGVPTFAQVRYTEVYAGIDMIYYGNQRRLEYDFRVAPGSDPRAVRLQFEGADKVEVDPSGDLLLTLGESIVRQPKPLVYQEVAGKRRAIDGGYALVNDGQVSFAIGEYDTQLPLVIDPVLVYSTYLGGSVGDQASEIAVDSAGNAYITGFTSSTDFPTANALQSTIGGFADAFVTKINAAGTAFVYSTYLGGNGGDFGFGIAVDSSGNAYVTGSTGSANFPTVNAIQATGAVFVTKINAAGTALVYSTYLGGTGGDQGRDIAVDAAGNAYVTGSTSSNAFPVVNALQSTYAGFTDAFVTKINAAGSALVYSTFLGGSDREMGEGINVDSAGNVYVIGVTSSTNFPVANAVQASSGGGLDAFISKINAAGSAFVYSTYLGGSDSEYGESIAPDSAGNAYVTGGTSSTNFPTANPIQPANGGTTFNQDAFVTKLNAAGSALVYSTYLGGTGSDIGFGIAVDSSGNAYIAGSTGSVFSFPTANAIQCTSAAGDVFVTKLNAAGSAFIYSTYLGGLLPETGRGIGLDAAGNAYIAGFTQSTDFPVVNPIQSTFGGDAPTSLRFPAVGDGFVAKISETTAGLASLLQFTQTALVVQEDVTSVTLTVSRTGDLSGPVTVDYATAFRTASDASERFDYTTAVGTLRFAAGETVKTFDLLVNEDSVEEANETFTVSLSNATGGATLSCPTAVATIQITDDATEPTTNVIDDSTIFVGQHYHDFLNRQSDPTGLAFWVNEIESCGADAQCRAIKRINVSAAFFLSVEFQQTGYFVFRFYKESFTDSPARPRGMPRYREFLRDTQEIRRGVAVGVGNWEQQLEANKVEFARQWVQRPEFISQFPTTMSAAEFVDKLFLNSQVTPTTAERNAAIAAFGAGDLNGRAAAVRSVADSNSVYNRQFNPAFVLMQYLGYLRRDPIGTPPGNDSSGYDFWLTKLNQFNGNYMQADMVKAFIISGEYRGRFRL